MKESLHLVCWLVFCQLDPGQGHLGREIEINFSINIEKTASTRSAGKPQLCETFSLLMIDEGNATPGWVVLEGIRKQLLRKTLFINRLTAEIFFGFTLYDKYYKYFFFSFLG